MQSSYRYLAESHYQHLRIRLAQPAPFVASQTSLTEIYKGVKIRLSGTNPCILLELECRDVAQLEVNNFLRSQFAQLCGPAIFAFIDAHHFHFSYDNYVRVPYDDIKTWQLFWIPIQNTIFEQSGGHAIYLIEYGDDFQSIGDSEENTEEDQIPQSPSNVRQLFS